MRRYAPALGLLLATLLPSTASQADEPVAVTLDNGLVVLVESVKDANGVAVALAIPYGRADDPPGQEGRAEVVLRAIALAKAGTAPERPPLSLQSVDRTGLKAFLTVARSCSGYAVRDAPEALPTLLADLAARFAALEPSEALLAGIRDYLGTLRAGAVSGSSAASVFHARVEALPEPHGNRPFGTEEGVNAVTLDAVKTTAKAALATHGAVVTIVGAIELSKVRPLVKKTLGAIPASDRPAPATGAAPAPASAPASSDPVRVAVSGPAATKRDAALALAGPAPADVAGLAAWLVLVARLCEKGGVPPGPGAFQVAYFPGVEPDLVTLRRAVAEGEGDGPAVAPMTAAVAEAKAGAVSAKDTLAVRKWLAPRLGLAPMEVAAGWSVLDRAFGLATMKVRGWDGQAAVDAVKKVKPEQLAALVEKGSLRSAIAVPR